MDKERLIKLMTMTTSANDGEALNAMRMANKMLTALGATWADVLFETPPLVTITLKRIVPEEYYQATESWSKNRRRPR